MQVLEEEIPFNQFHPTPIPAPFRAIKCLRFLSHFRILLYSIALPPRASMLHNLISVSIKVYFNSVPRSCAVQNLCIWNEATLIIIPLISFNLWLRFHFLSAVRAKSINTHLLLLNFCWYPFFLLISFPILFIIIGLCLSYHFYVFEDLTKWRGE